MKHLLKLTMLLALVFLNLMVSSQTGKKEKIRCISFYNLENLYDTINQSDVDDEEFTPAGKNNWDRKKYREKLTHMSEVISKIGIDVTPDGPAVIGVSEIENRSVLEDLVKQPSLKSRNYRIVHFDGPDRRGVDCALFYNPKYFKMTNAQSRPFIIAGDTSFHTRDQLVVSGIFDGEPMHFVVNHWPSRSGGQKGSEYKRLGAANVTRSIVDSLLAIDPKAKIMVMGDLNDDPIDKSVKKVLNTATDEKVMLDGQLFNPMAKMLKNGIGSLAYRDSWNLFDQIILSQALLGEDKTTYKYYKAVVFNKTWITTKDGTFKGYPFRTYSYGSYIGGYSDHFPVMVFIIKKK